VVGAGVSGGFNAVDTPSRDQTFEQVNVRTRYELTGKVSLSATAGVEFRQFNGSDSEGTNVSPVFEIAGTYEPFDGTTLTLAATRRTLNSAVLATQDYARTDFVLTITQRFLQRVHLGLAAGYNNLSYFSTIRTLAATREDDYFFFQPSIDVMVTRFLSIGAYYVHRENESTIGDFSFEDNQLGVRALLSF
jgi:hypothetical protein